MALQGPDADPAATVDPALAGSGTVGSCRPRFGRRYDGAGHAFGRQRDSETAHMTEQTVPDPERAAPAAAIVPGGFRLLRYFTIATLAAFTAVALAVYFLQRMEEEFFAQVQREQAAFLSSAQAQLARQHEDAARSSLLEVNETSHVNLTRLVANQLWQTDFAPLVAAAQRLSIGHCRALPAGGDASVAMAHPPSPPAPTARRNCFAKVGRSIMALPGFSALDRKAYATMRATTVFKIKVFDLRGLTVYSSEHGQIGEDAADNQGWRSAAAGQPASELTHRDKFSAFERVVENRDLISTYVPLRTVGGDEVVGVFEIYADVTPFLGQMKAASKKFADVTAANQAHVEQTAQSNQDKVNTSSNHFLGIVGSLLALLYAASLLIVRYGQRIIDAQTVAQAQSARREQLWHREKMAALATMAANVSHEVGNPLAVISSLAEELADAKAGGAGAADAGKRILEQTARIARMTRQIADFAAARSESPEWVDVNALVKAVCGFLAFDRRFRGTPIEFHAGQRLPASLVVPDHLNEALMDLLQACVEVAPGRTPSARIRVETMASSADVVIRIVAEAAPGGVTATAVPAFAELRLAQVRRRVIEMGGRLSATAVAAEITLPPPQGSAAPT